MGRYHQVPKSPILSGFLRVWPRRRTGVYLPVPPSPVAIPVAKVRAARRPPLRPVVNVYTTMRISVSTMRTIPVQRATLTKEPQRMPRIMSASPWQPERQYNPQCVAENCARPAQVTLSGGNGVAIKVENSKSQ